MPDSNTMNVQYITDDQGNRKAVVMSVEEYDDLLEDLHDLAVVAERRNEETVAHKDVVEELKREGLL